MGCLGLCLVALVQIIAGCGIWAGKSVGTVLLLVPKRRRIPSVWIFCLRSSDTLKSCSLLLAGELPLRYYSGNFALRKPSWSLPDVGGVQALLSVLVLVWLSFRLLGVGLTLGVAGLEELEGLGKECDLPRKRSVR